jgi:tetratricopeptide (TPR) repeat protein
MTSRARQTLVAVALVAVAAALPFVGAWGNDFVAFDDDFTLVHNPEFRGLSPAHLRWMLTTFTGGYWQPLAWVTFALDHAVWGMEPRGYHLTAIVLHVVTAVLVWLLLRALLVRAAVRDASDTAIAVGATVGAVLWAVHPLRVEVVAWATERRLLLGALFFLVAVLAHMRVADRAAAGRSRAPWIAATFVATVLSLLAGPWAVTLPAALLVLDVFPLRRLQRETPLGLLVEKLPLAVLALAELVVLRFSTDGLRMSLDDHPLPARLAQAAWGIWFYIGKTLWPVDLSPLYELQLPLDPTAARFVVAAFATLVVTGVLVAQRRRWPGALAAWTAYLILLAPVLGLQQTGPHLVADRYTYLAGIPLSALLAAGVARVWVVVSGAGIRVAVLAASAAVAVVLGVAAASQTRVWRDSESLWRQAVALDEANALAQYSLGLALNNQGRADEAAEAFARLEAITVARPGDPNARQYLGLVRATDANAAARAGDVDRAVALYEQAIELAPRDPRPYLQLGALLVRRGAFADAVPVLEAGVAVDPTDTSLRYVLAAALARTGRRDEAVARLEEVLRLDPEHAEARQALDVLSAAPAAPQ